MKVEIYSYDAMLKRLDTKSFPENTAVISFCSPRHAKRATQLHMFLSSFCNDTYRVVIPDIDIEILEQYGYTYETYLSCADEIAEFVYRAYESGKDIVCQCDFGQSRSAACAAAILQHFEGRGIDIFADYRYYPNQLVYNKIFTALQEYKKRK